MTEAHICDECKTVASIGGAVHWWRLESIEGIVVVGEKEEYHFCGWNCLRIYVGRMVLMFSAR